MATVENGVGPPETRGVHRIELFGRGAVHRQKADNYIWHNLTWISETRRIVVDEKLDWQGTGFRGDICERRIGGRNLHALCESP